MPFIPILEVEAVRLALEAMRQAEPLGAAHPLARFISLCRTDTPTSSAALDALIFRSLAKLIRKRLNQHRSLYGLATALPHKDSQAAGLDFQVGNTELEAWSVLYYRYVRVDLDLSLDQLEAITQQDRRTLHRRQSKGIARLTHDLIRRELRARARQRKAALRAQLPLPYAPQLIGRAELMASALAWLNAPRPPRHLILSGAPGVGKSALALALAHRLIEEDIIQRVVWIARPHNLVEQIAVELGLAPDPDGSLARQVILSTYLQRVDTLVVIDDAQELVEDARTLAAMLQTLGAARLLICASSPSTPGLRLGY
jgi:Cdc6-like AAA superfamily ATPase